MKIIAQYEKQLLEYLVDESNLDLEWQSWKVHT